jgi:hypothetical protein
MAYTKKIWKDYPDATTQIKAEYLNNIENGIDDVDSRLVTAESDIDTAEANITNLQNVTKYITATAGSNGDFNINLGVTPYTGMIVYVSFPSATTSTSNARLSINNGTNYYNIKSLTNENIKASVIQNVNYLFRFDGTNFILYGINNYSTTTELPIGIWTDGKTIYRKTFIGNLPTLLTSNWTNVFAISGVSKSIKIYGILTRGDGSIIEVPRYENANYNLLLDYSSGYIRALGIGYNGFAYTISVEYTKN